MENLLYSLDSKEPLEIFQKEKRRETHIDCMCAMHVPSSRLPESDFFRFPERFRQSNWVVMFRNVWKRKEIGDKNLTVITSDLTCNYIGMEKKK